KIGPDPRNFNQRVSLGRNDLLIRTFLNAPPFQDDWTASLTLRAMLALPLNWAYPDKQLNHTV
ncbi:hypothetical protein V6145_22110, partial [Klebsiella pneumoniae]